MYFTSVPTSPLDDALMAANEGLKRSLVDVLRTRSNVGTEPFFGKPRTIINNQHNQH